MKGRTLLLVLLFAALAAFAAANWQAFATPTTLSLVFTAVQAPLGLVLLGFIGVLSAMFLAFVAYVQGAALVEARRQARELEAQRKIAQDAESSRYAELRTHLDAELRKLAQRQEELQAMTVSRLDRIDHDFGEALERNEGSTAAYIGELGERLDRRHANGAEGAPRALPE
jgi:uncharacterized integral membrane protein